MVSRRAMAAELRPTPRPRPRAACSRPGGGLGSFLRSAGTTAAGVAGGEMLFSGLSACSAAIVAAASGAAAMGRRPRGRGEVTINEYGETADPTRATIMAAGTATGPTATDGAPRGSPCGNCGRDRLVLLSRQAPPNPVDERRRRERVVGRHRRSRRGRRNEAAGARRICADRPPANREPFPDALSAGGITWKLLHVSPEAGTWTAVFDCPAGSSFNAHIHTGPGEYLLYKGRMDVRGGAANGGDTAVAPGYGLETG